MELEETMRLDETSGSTLDERVRLHELGTLNHETGREDHGLSCGSEVRAFTPTQQGPLPIYHTPLLHLAFPSRNIHVSFLAP